MTEKEQRNTLAGIQAALDDMQGTGVDILFLASLNNRGVFGGTIEGLAAMFAWNMVKYRQFRLIMALAEKLYATHREEIEKMVNSGTPSHEIVNNFGEDFDKWIIRNQ